MCSIIISVSTTDLAFFFTYFRNRNQAGRQPCVRFFFTDRTKYHTINRTKGETMSITATQLKENLGYYLALAATETIFISKNGKNIAVLSSPETKKPELLASLRGIIPDEGKTMKDYRADRIAERYS